MAMYINARVLDEKGINFSVVLEGADVKCYGVSKDNWRFIEKSHEDFVGLSVESKPLVILDDSFKATAKQMGWVIVGTV